MPHKVNTLVAEPYGNVLTISVLGAGGTGSLFVGTLARLNQAYMMLRRKYLQVRVFDPAKVREANRGRQGFSLADVGAYKAKSLVERINRFYSTQWQGIPRRWEDSLDLVQSNIIVSCTDTASSRIKLASHLEHWTKTKDHPKKFAYWLDMGNTKMTCQVILGGYGKEPVATEISEKEFINNGIQDARNRIKEMKKSPAYRLPFITEMYDLAKYESEDTTPSCSLFEALESQHIMINDMSAKLGGMLIWDLLMEKELTWCGGYFNLKTLNSKRIKC